MAAPASDGPRRRRTEAEAIAATAAQRRVPATEKQAKKFMTAISQRDYLVVIKMINEGISANTDWKGLLPLRTAVLIGDVDMVAILHRKGDRVR